MALADYLQPIESLHLQAMNKWMYDRGVRRVQLKYTLARSVHWFTFPIGNRFKQMLIRYEDGRQGACQQITREEYEFQKRMSIQIKDNLYAIDPNNLAVTKYSKPFQGGLSEKTELAELGFNRSGCGLAVYQNRMIYVTGGENKIFYVSRETYIYDIALNQWYSRTHFTPNLKQARSFHSSCTLGGRVYVFCGSDGQRCFGSVEVLDLELGRKRKVDDKETVKEQKV